MTGILISRIPNNDRTKTNTNMKTFLKKFEWLYEYYIVYYLFSPNKLQRYHTYMRRKWKDRYCTQEEFDDYLRNLHK
jgi:hypothetical protein